MDPIEQFKKDVTQVNLREDEKQQLKKEMAAFMISKGEIPSANRPIPSPFFMSIFSSRITYSLAALSLLIVLTAQQAEASLPGDFLYPVKINVTEPAIELLAFTNEAEAATKINFTKKRLNETVRLAAEGKLEKEHVDEIRKRIDGYNNEVNEFVTDSARKGRIADAIETATELRAVLSAHRKVLNSMSQTLEGIEQDIVDLQNDLDIDQTQITDRVENPETEEKLRNAPEEEIAEEAEYSLLEVEEAIEEILASYDTESASSTVASIRALVEEGKERIVEKDFDAAFLILQEAEQIADEVEIISESQEIFEESAELRSAEEN